ncbi:MAG: DUF1566 domain-containing protein [Alphaproteobacteria bacterium]|nr:DUF1566 domain-containing protein [Alphaproteobacteria bacterium]OJV47699.1 MAG: hypothetical protein BGO28_05910 [Alphaproteobacteria bacterium 43-37]
MDTGLIWQRDMLNQTNQGKAAAYCQTLSLGSHHTWRLPTIKELITMMDYATSFPSFNISVFPDIPEDYGWPSLWTSTPVVGQSGLFFNINFDFGNTNAIDATAANTRCVRT